MFSGSQSGERERTPLLSPNTVAGVRDVATRPSFPEQCEPSNIITERNVELGTQPSRSIVWAAPYRVLLGQCVSERERESERFVVISCLLSTSTRCLKSSYDCGSGGVDVPPERLYYE